MTLLPRTTAAGGALAMVALAPAVLLALRPAAKEEPIPFEATGRLVCVAEAMREEWRAEVPPVHDHVLGLKVSDLSHPGAAAGASAGPAYLVLLRTPIAEGLFADPQFGGQTMILRGRVFPRMSLAEVTSYGWIRDGKRHELYYWCDVCSIRGRNPASCACCQAKVELREEPGG
jgi:hypothetical protein